jgi:hypothetical protein
MRTREDYQIKAELYRMMAKRVGGAMAEYWLRLATEFELVARGLKPPPSEDVEESGG